jgi:hypothetical protein
MYKYDCNIFLNIVVIPCRAGKTGRLVWRPRNSADFPPFFRPRFSRQSTRGSHSDPQKIPRSSRKRHQRIVLSSLHLFGDVSSLSLSPALTVHCHIITASTTTMPGTKTREQQDRYNAKRREAKRLAKEAKERKIEEKKKQKRESDRQRYAMKKGKMIIQNYATPPPSPGRQANMTAAVTPTTPAFAARTMGNFTPQRQDHLRDIAELKMEYIRNRYDKKAERLVSQSIHTHTQRIFSFYYNVRDGILTLIVSFSNRPKSKRIKTRIYEMPKKLPMIKLNEILRQETLKWNETSTWETLKSNETSPWEILK